MYFTIPSIEMHHYNYINGVKHMMKLPETLEIDPRYNFGKKVTVAKNNQISCYSKKQMKFIYPRRKFRVAAEMVVGKPKNAANANAALIGDNKRFLLYQKGTHNKYIYRATGYLPLKDYPNSFAVILKNRLSVYLCMVILASALVFGGVQLYRNFIANDPLIPAADIDDNAVDWQGDLPSADGGSGESEGIRIPGYKSITIAADEETVDVSLVNPAENSCYFVLRIVLIDANETLFESKMIEPGKGLYSITLSRALPAGTYKAQLQYEPYDMTTLTRLNGAVVNFDLIVQ